MTATTCARCGEAIPPGARFCARCGADVSGPQGNVATAFVAPTDLLRATAPAAALIELLRQATIGEYDVQGELGRGGMAAVFLAHEIALDRKVAIKVMSPALLTGEGMAERFKREARTAASLSHPNIIPIYAVKESAHLLFFVMKVVEGRSLDSVIKDVGALPIPLVQAVLHQVGDALGYAHRRGIIHRDIKPANIMVDLDGHTIVTDFGIAKVVEAKGLTMTGATVGTPAYMSPEQCAAKDITGASDQYSLGIVAYEMLTGQPPFDAETVVGLLYAQCNTQPPQIRDMRGDLAPPIAAAVMRMLEKDPTKRFPSVEEAVKALGGRPLDLDDPLREEMKLLARQGTAAELRAKVKTPVSPIPTTRISERTRSRVRPNRRGMKLALGGIVAIAGVALATTRPWRSRNAPSPRDTIPATSTQQLSQVVTPAESAPAKSPPAQQSKSPATVVPGGGRRVMPQPLSTRQTTAASASPAPEPPPAIKGDSTYRAQRDQVVAERQRAVAAGATDADLAPADQALRNADNLAADGRLLGAMGRLLRSGGLMQQAARAARARAADAEAARSAAPNPAPAATSPATAVDPAAATLQSVVAEYAAALGSYDVERLRRIYPNLTLRQEEGMRRLWRRARDLRVTLRLANLTHQGQTAEGQVEGEYAYTSPATHVIEHQPVFHRVAFQQKGSAWVLTAIE